MRVAKLAIGVDIGGTRTKIGLVDLTAGEVVATIIAPTEKVNSAIFLHNIKVAIDELRPIAALKGQIEGIGFGVPGFILENGIVDSTYGFLSFMEDYPLKSLISDSCGLECRLDNDARMVALGETLYGRAKNYNRVLVLTLGTGLGLGFVVNEKLENPLPFEHMGGHMSIGDSDVRCYCGKQGCLEALVSATGVVAAAVKRGWDVKYPALPLDAETIFDSAANGNADSKKIILTMIGYLQRGIDNYINLYAPDIIVIGGGIAKGMNPYLSLLNSQGILRPYKNYQVAIELSILDEHSGILGSAALFNN